VSILIQRRPTSPGGYAPDAIVLAVDGGGSKTDMIALTMDGQLVAQVRGPGSNPHVLGLERSLSIIRGIAADAHAMAGKRRLIHTSIYLSGIDFPAEIDAFSAAIAQEPWTEGSAGLPPVVDNDLFALLRAGTSEPDAVAVVCGTGINAVGVRADGATARFPALGTISGDWGGGGSLGAQALWHAARSEDGRGPKSVLQELVPQAYGLSSVMEVIEAIHFKKIRARTIVDLTPVLFAAAASGDEAAAAEIDRQAQEIVIMAVTALHRLELQDSHVPVVLGGGVLGSNDLRLMTGIASGLKGQAPNARIQLVKAAPILGAGLLALESVGASPEAIARAQSAMQKSAKLSRPRGKSEK